jgi:hypothetical protein
MYQYLIPLVVRFLLSTVVSNLPMVEWKKAAKDWVFKTVPGKWFDEAAWAVVEGAWDIILGEVTKQFPKGVAANSKMDDAWAAVASVSAEVMPKVAETVVTPNSHWKKR